MYDYAIKCLESEARKLELEMKDSLKMEDWFGRFNPTKEVTEKQASIFSEVVLKYQNQIYDLKDAIETLKSIHDGGEEDDSTFRNKVDGNDKG
jgi:hypothetical protein